MNYYIAHQTRGRIRVVTTANRISQENADRLEAYLMASPAVSRVQIHERTGSVAVCYCGDPKGVLELLDHFELTRRTGEKKILPQAAGKQLPADSSRHIREYYREAATGQILRQAAIRILLPAPIRTGITIVRSVRIFGKAIRSFLAGRIRVALLDGVALAASFLTADYETAATHTFLLGLCELLEKWVEANKTAGLSGLMELNVDYVCMRSQDTEVLAAAESIRNGDLLVVRGGEMIPFDGLVIEGVGNTCETALSGNAIPVFKEAGHRVFAGSVLNEGELLIRVEEADNWSQYEKLALLVENTENLKPEYEIQAMKKADRMVPLLFAGSALTWLATRDISRMASFLMVDLSYALKLSLPVAVLQAKEKAEQNHIRIRGGRFMEAVAISDTIIFDKTGTITKAEPQLHRVVALGGYEEKELLTMAACVEEHMPQASAQAIARAADELGLSHEDLYTELEHVVAHGIITHMSGRRVLIGSYHFVFEDEGVPRTEEVDEFIRLHGYEGEQHVFMAIDGMPAAIFCLGDRIREEAEAVVTALRGMGFAHILLLTGDARTSAEQVAESVGIREYISEMSPEGKAARIRQLKESGRTVLMVGDGINDALAIAEADVGIAIGNGSDMACAAADVILEDADLRSLLQLRRICEQLQGRMHRDYHFITTGNTALALAGAAAVLSPAAASTIGTAITVGSVLL